MSFKKSTLTKLNKDLIKYNIKSKSLNAAAEETGKSKEWVRLVLKGDYTDKDNIIDFLSDCVYSEKNRIKKVSDKIDAA